MKLFLVHVGFGYWVVRAEDEAGAITAAFADVEGPASYGYESGMIDRVQELPANGPAEVLWYTYG